ncbi:unnamed protein product [Oikopleura dioica]|uniref:PCI domain-containing protein n=1 Tax=Oikopleura dioica TaxID=34765 RepID=E4XC34_OIKDI|nr:unnamed protein product [Oikopleura dioica]
MAGAACVAQPTNNDLQQLYHDLNSAKERSDQETIRKNEAKIIELGEWLQKQGNAKELGELVKNVRPYLGSLSKAKAARLVRTLVDLFLDMDSAIGVEVDLCKECIQWAMEEKRTYLRQALEARLMALYFDTNNYKECLTLGQRLYSELKKLDDKALLVEIQLTESKAYHSIGNLQNSRAALTSARTTANAIYCPPRTQANLDMQAGILHAAENKDWKTAFSYFYEAFEGFDSCDLKKKAVQNLRYMIMCKIMNNKEEEVSNLLTAKLAFKYKGPEIDAMKEICQASADRDVHKLEAAFVKYQPQLSDDTVVQEHLVSLKSNLLEKNLMRLIEPYSRVEISKIAKLIDLDELEIELKLSQMILDKKLIGILSQEDRALQIFEPSESDKVYEDSLEMIGALEDVVASLYKKAEKLK